MPEIEKIIPLTTSQKELYVSTLIGGLAASKAYNESYSLFLSGTIDEKAFAGAFDMVAARHESLRSVISEDGETMVVYKETIQKLQVANISELQEPAQEQYIKDLVSSEAETAIDIHKGPLYRAYFITIAPEEHQFIFTAHYIIFDDRSMSILLHDLGIIYSATVKKQDLTLPQAELFSDYATAVTEFDKTEKYKQTIDFWLKQFTGWKPKFDFPTDYERPTQRTYNSARIDLPIKTELVLALKTLGEQNGCNLETIFIVAFELFLHRASGQKDIIFGLPSSGQAASGNSNVVGHCVNMLPMSSRITPQDSIGDYIAKRKMAIADGYAHQQISFGSLLHHLSMPRDGSRITLVPISFNVDLSVNKGLHFEGLQHQLRNNPRHYETFDFFLNLSSSGNDIILEWSYNTKLFAEETIHKLHELFEQIVLQISNQPDIQISNLPDLSSFADKAAYTTLNNTYYDYPREKTVDQLIKEATDKYPESVAIVFEGQTLTYQQLENLSDQAANYFISKGLQRGDIAGVAIKRSAYLPVFLLGIMKAGAVFQPIDPQYPANRINYILEDGGAKILVCGGTERDNFTTNALVLAEEDIIASLPSQLATAPKIVRDATDLIYILHTSGTTGLPKGVMIQHRNVVNHLLGMLHEPGLLQSDVLLSVTSISFDIFYLELFLPLIIGAKMVLMSSDKAKDTGEIANEIRSGKITVVQTTPATWNSILNIVGDEKLPVKVICGGEALSVELAQRLIKATNEVWNVYGPTEATIWASAIKINAGDEVITVGKPIYNTRFYLLDEALNLVPAGKTGELFIAGDNVGVGYINKPELSAEKFLPDTIAGIPGEKMYRTGDLGRLLPDGNVQCLGRADEQIKINGYRIEPQGIEQWMRILNPDLKQVVVAAVMKNGLARLAAYYVTSGAPVTSEEWKKQLKEHIPSFMIPQYYVVMTRLPLTPNGKIDKKSLPVPEDSYNNAADNQPTNPEELLLQQIWDRLLKTTKIGINDDFFESGGHSLIAVLLMQEILKETGKKLPLASVFEYPTIRSLATLIKDEGLLTNTYKSLVAIKPTGSKTPLYMVHGAGLNVLVFYPLVKHMDEDQPVYGLQALGSDGSEIKEITIEEIATAYNKEILASLKGDELSIVGYSLGGVIAVEMAKQLKHAGKKVKMLGLIDTYLDNEDFRHSTLKRYTIKALRQPRKLLHVLEGLTNHSAKTIEYQRYILSRKFSKMTGNTSTDETADTALSDKINDHYEHAYVSYKMTPAENKIHLFKVQERLYYVDDPKYLGWKPYAQHGLTLVEVPGDHKTFLLPPYDKIFAEKLQSALDNLD